MDGQEETGNDLEEKAGWKGIVRRSSIIISKSHGQAIWFILRDVWAEDFLNHSLFFHTFPFPLPSSLGLTSLRYK